MDITERILLLNPKVVYSPLARIGTHTPRQFTSHHYFVRLRNEKKRATFSVFLDHYEKNPSVVKCVGLVFYQAYLGEKSFELFCDHEGLSRINRDSMLLWRQVKSDHMKLKRILNNEYNKIMESWMKEN